MTIGEVDLAENGDSCNGDLQLSDSEVQVFSQTDGNASFLRAARAGNLDKVLEYLKGSIDINTSNANGLNALHLASKEGHVTVVNELLKRGANVNAATKKGNTALHIASLAGQEEVVRILVSSGASVNVQSQNGFTPLYMAAQENHDSVVRFLLANGANQSLATEDGFTPLAVALQQGHDKVVAVLLENDAKGKIRLPALHIAAKKDDCKAAALLLQNDHNPDVTSKSGFTPLHIAAHYGNENIASLLLEKNADVNFSAKHQITPLHVAAKWGKPNMVTILVDKGGKIETATRDGLTPLHCAARSGHDQVVDLLLERGAPITAKTKNGLAPLHMASQGDHVDSARILLYHKAPVDDVTVDYLTALHVAAHCGHVRVAKLLLDRKADPNARALNGFTPLHIACKKNRIKVVELLLKHGASIEATTESGLTPLHVASFMGCMNIVIYLIQHGANPDVPTVRGETPLHLAARANQTDIIRILLRNGAHVDARAREEQTPLHIAARLGNVDIVGLLLQHGAAVDATTKDMYTALHIAAKEGQEEVASVLLDHAASLTATTKKGFTPLHLAAKYGNIKVARLLLQKDAPVDAQGKNGVTPLHVAAHYDHVNVALLLLDKGASPHATAKNGYTPLHIAAKKNQMDIATTLLEYGAKADSDSKAGFTPLHLAAQEGHTDMTTLLIEHHADVGSKSKNGLTPLHLCSQEDRVNVAAILVKSGAETDPPTKAGYTPLHVACHFGQSNMIRFLLQHGADVNAINSHGYTPLHQAAQQGHTLIINLLLEHRASPNVTTNQGQTALSIAQRLGYISVVETLKVVTETVVTTTTTTITEEKYRVVAPETMQETFMSDSEDEGGEDFEESALFGKPTHATHVYLPYYEGHLLQTREDTIMGDQSFRYLSADEMKSLGDDSLPIDVTKDERGHDISRDNIAPLTEEEEHLSPQHIHNLDSVFSSSFAPDNVDISRAPIHAGKLKWRTFLVSFMVDARGGAMRGCRHSGVRVIIPPRKAPMPMRITCRYLRKEKLIHPPPLMEGEACASRILEIGPAGAKFLGPVIIEVPHFASLRGKEREITIMRSDNGETWKEHTLEASEEAVQDVLNESFDGEDLSALEDLNTNRITRILTTDFPQYFALVTRVRQEVHAIGPEGGMVSSTVVPQVQAIFPEAALTKKIKVGLQAQPISPELVAKLLGNRVAVSPIVTVEPRRRKFHKPITLTIPVPQAATKGMINQYSGDAPTLRLLCSITGGTAKAQWEDVTGSTPLTFVNDCVSFTTTVSARFWLMDCRQVNEATKYATELYREAIHVPFMAKFVVFSKRPDPMEAELRVFCMTDDKEDKTLENQEHFIEVAKSRDVEVLESKPQYVEFAGNLVPVTKSGDQLSLSFQAFRENRLPFMIRVKDPHQEPLGRVAFMREPKVGRGEPPQTPICNLNIVLPDVCKADGTTVTTSELITLEKKYGFVEETGLAKPELIHKADLRLSDIARELGNDWVPLAQQLDIADADVKAIKADNPDDIMQQALTMLRLWMQKAGTKATGNSLDKALRKINREDIINKCMFNVKLFTDEVERAVAKVHLDQSGFDAFKEELGPSRDASLRREISLDVSYDEQDMMKEAESAAESSSESGSLHGKELPDRLDVKDRGSSLRTPETVHEEKAGVTEDDYIVLPDVNPAQDVKPTSEAPININQVTQEECSKNDITVASVTQEKIDSDTQVIVPGEDSQTQEQVPEINQNEPIINKEKTEDPNPEIQGRLLLDSDPVQSTEKEIPDVKTDAGTLKPTDSVTEKPTAEDLINKLTEALTVIDPEPSKSQESEIVSSDPVLEEPVEKKEQVKAPELPTIDKLPDITESEKPPVNQEPEKLTKKEPEKSSNKQQPEKSPEKQQPEKSPNKQQPEKSPEKQQPEKSPEKQKASKKTKAKAADKSAKGKEPEKSPKKIEPEKAVKKTEPEKPSKKPEPEKPSKKQKPDKKTKGKAPDKPTKEASSTKQPEPIKTPETQKPKINGESKNSTTVQEDKKQGEPPTDSKAAISQKQPIITVPRDSPPHEVPATVQISEIREGEQPFLTDDTKLQPVPIVEEAVSDDERRSPAPVPEDSKRSSVIVAEHVGEPSDVTGLMDMLDGFQKKEQDKPKVTVGPKDVDKQQLVDQFADLLGEQDTSADEQKEIEAIMRKTKAQLADFLGQAPGTQQQDPVITEPLESEGEERVSKGLKTPPPSPAEREDKEHRDLFGAGSSPVRDGTRTARVETREVMEDGSVRKVVTTVTKTSLMQDSGENQQQADFREQLTKQLESETWPSAEMDTSQVSVSSLPEDEKSEPTTATVSTDGVPGDGTRVKTHSDETEWTETDESGAVKHVIQKTTHTTVKIQGDHPFGTQGTEKSETAVKMRRDQKREGSPKGDESSQEEEELSFEQKKHYFQRLSLESAAPIPLTKSTTKGTESKPKGELAESEIVEEQISFADRRKFFELGKTSSGDSETTTSADMTSETREYSLTRGDLDEPQELDEYVRTMIAEESEILHKTVEQPQKELKFLQQEEIIEAKVSPTVSASIGDLTIRKMTSDDEYQHQEQKQEKWKELDQDIQQARETMESMEKELMDVVQAKEAQEVEKLRESHLVDKPSSESKLIVKTSTDGKETVEVRTMKTFGDSNESEIARVLVRSVVSPESDDHREEHSYQDQWSEQSQEQVISQDYPSPIKSVAFEEVESPIPRPSPPEPSLELEEEISPAVEYPSTLTPEMQVHVGVSPTEMYSSHQDSHYGTRQDSQQSTEGERDVFGEDQYIEINKGTVLRSVTSRSWTDSSGTMPSESSVDSDNEPTDRVMAYENTAFVGAEIIDEFEQTDEDDVDNVEARSPYEVVRKVGDKSLVSTALSDSSFETDMAVDFAIEKRYEMAECFEKLTESSTDFELHIKSQILSEELDQSLEESLPETKPLSRDASTDILNDIDREQHYVQQIRSEIFTNELEEDIDRGSPERKELVCDSKETHDSSDSDASMVVHPDLVAGSELTQQSPDGLSLETCEIYESSNADAGESAPEDMAESVPSDMVESLPSEEAASEDNLYSGTEDTEPPVQSEKMELVFAEENQEHHELLSAEEHITEQIMWETPVQQESDESMAEEVSSIPTVKQLIIEHDESDDVQDSDRDREDEQLACGTTEMTIGEIKTAVSFRPPLMHIPSEISDEDLVEREEHSVEREEHSVERGEHSPHEHESKPFLRDPELLPEVTEIIEEPLEPQTVDIEKEQYSDEDSHQKEDRKVFSDSDVPITITPSESSDTFDHSETAKLTESSKLHEPKKTDHKSDLDISDKHSQESLVVLRRKKREPRPDEKRYSKEFESYSSSGETESHYCSFETSESTRTPRETPVGSRPTSSEFEINIASGQISEYDTCVTSQEGSYMTAASSQDTFQTARSSMSHSDRESAYSIDSESSGHMASLEMSSEASETLVPSAQELEMDLVPEVQTPTPDDDALRSIMQEPYETEIPESVIRSGVEVPYMRDWQPSAGNRSSQEDISRTMYYRYDDDEDDDDDETYGKPHKPASKEQRFKSSEYSSRGDFSSKIERSDSSESCSSTAGSNSPTLKMLSMEKSEVSCQKEEADTTELGGTAADDEPLSVSESSVTQSDTTWQTLSTETVIYTTTSTAVQPQVTYSVSHIGEQTSWYSQANGPVEVEYMPEYDANDDFSDSMVDHQILEQHTVEVAETDYPSAPTMFQSQIPSQTHTYASSAVVNIHTDTIVGHGIHDVHECVQEHFPATGSHQEDDNDTDSEARRGSLKASQHPSLPESDLQDDFAVVDSPDGPQPECHSTEIREPQVDENSYLPESDQGALQSSEVHAQSGFSYAHRSVTEIASTSLTHSVVLPLSTTTTDFLEKGLDTSPEDDQYEAVVPEYLVDAPAMALGDIPYNENELVSQGVFSPSLKAPPAYETEEAMEVESDKCPEEKDEIEEDPPEAPYGYGMQFEKEHEFEDPHSYNDLYTHQEEDEEIFDGDDEKAKAFGSPSPAPSSFGSPAPSMFDTLAGRKLFGKSGEQDDASTSSLQEFERLEAEFGSGRKSSIGSVDSLTALADKPAPSKSGEHDDVSVNSLTEFEKLERELVNDPEKLDALTKEPKLSEIDEGHESQASEGSQGTISEHGDDHSNDSDDYEKRLSEIDEIIRQAQSNVEMFVEGTDPRAQKIPEGKKLPRRSGTLSSNGSTESSVVDRSPSPKREDDSLDGDVPATCLPHLSRQEAIDSTVIAPPMIPRHVLAERTISGQSMESVESLPKSSAGSTATQYDTESLRDQDLEVDEADEEKSHASFYEREDLEHDSLHQDDYGVEHDSLQEPSQEIDSLQEMASVMQDSLYLVKDIDQDELFLPEPIERVFTSHSLSTRHDAGMTGQLTEILEEYSRKQTEPIVIENVLKGDCMLSSTDSLEVSSSTATHATYQFETDSVMSSSLNSVQTSGEESTMVSSTDTLEPEAKLSYSFSEGDSVIMTSTRKPFLEGGISSYSNQDVKVSSEVRGSTTYSPPKSEGSTSESTKTAGPSIYSDPDDGLWESIKEMSCDGGPSSQEIRSVDDKGNVVITKKIRRTVVLDPQASDPNLPFESEEKMKEFLKQTAFGKSSGDEEVEEKQTVDETGNVVITRTVKRHVMSEPQVHTETFLGPDAEMKSQEFLKSLEEMRPTQDLDEFEDTDEHGNLIRVTQQVIIKPEVRTMTFTGPDAQQQLEDFMRSCNVDSQYPPNYKLQEEDPCSASAQFPSYPFDATDPSTASSDMMHQTTSVHSGGHPVTGRSGSYAYYAPPEDRTGLTLTEDTDADFRDGDEIQVRNDFHVEGGFGDGTFTNSVVTTRTTTRVFPDGEQEHSQHSSDGGEEPDPLRRSMQDILDQFMKDEQQNK